MPAKLPPFPGTTGRRDWKTAFDAIKKLMANGDDTTQVFRIMRALNVGNAPMNYAKFIATTEGGRMAYERHTHDIWHVLTGYKADESMGEAALVAFSYAQVGGLGWAFIGGAAALKSRKVTGNNLFMKAVWEGYRRGRKAKWISGEDYEALLHEPLDQARRRLNLGEPVAYLKAQRELGALASYMSPAKAVAAVEPEKLAA